ncbi:MAG: hypothetical protein WKH64_18685 [Chloroflexia bacterium]
MVEFEDGSLKAQLGIPDMRVPIQYALAYPRHLPNARLPRMDWSAALTLEFGPPDLERFPCLRLALEAGRLGGTFPAVLSTADEVAVAAFVRGDIGFMDIPSLVERALEAHDPVMEPDLEAVRRIGAETRRRVSEWVHLSTQATT